MIFQAESNFSCTFKVMVTVHYEYDNLTLFHTVLEIFSYTFYYIIDFNFPIRCIHQMSNIFINLVMSELVKLGVS